MKLICINIELNQHTERVLSFLKKENPDVVCIQELLEEDFPIYKKELGMEGIFESFSFIRDLHRPEVIGKKQGIAIFSKKIINSSLCFYEGKKDNLLVTFEEYSTDEKYRKNKVLLWVDVKDSEGDNFKFITTHLPATIEGSVTEHQLEVIDLLLRELQKIPEFVLCGDTNAPRGREAFARLADKYKDNIPKEYITSIDQNLHRKKGIMFMVDGLFTTPCYKAENVKLVDGLSDHMAIVADIKVDRSIKLK